MQVIRNNRCQHNQQEQQPVCPDNFDDVINPLIFDKLDELIASGEIADIIEQNDEIDNKIPVFYISKGELKESHTDEFGWPNTTFDGHMMHNNTHFKTKEEAIAYGIREHEIAWELERFMREAGAEKAAWHPFIVAAGSNSAMPHYSSGLRKI